MAHMIPSDGGLFSKNSKEKEMFEALKHLSDDYYIFHSFKLIKLIPDKGLLEHEIDFLIFNPKYGCLFLEAKNRTLRKENNQWEFFDRDKDRWEKMEDPFIQAFSAQHNLFNKFREVYKTEYDLYDIIKRCKFAVGIWLPKYTQREIEQDVIKLGPTASKELILTKDELFSEEKLIKKIDFLMARMNRIHLKCTYEEEIIDAAGYAHKLSYGESMRFLDEVLNPSFKTIVNIDKDRNKRFIELLEEQSIVLDFLKYQKKVAISGGSGTGKTLIAVERARRLSKNNSKVLFLCYNKNLAEWLDTMYSKELKNVDFFTLDGYACKVLKTSYEKINYHDLYSVVFNEMTNNTFEYEHIIIDEGQDFGRLKIDAADILELFSSYTNFCPNNNASFYIFYDENQLVNSDKIPKYLNNVDSKITLYKNCRNTKNIAKTAYALLDKKIEIHPHAYDGELTKIIYYKDELDLSLKLDKLLDKLKNKINYEKVIISCGGSLSRSELSSKIVEEKYKKPYYKSNNLKTKIYTSATFKGLESDCVILVDVVNSVFDDDNKSFYVAASRAKKELFVFIKESELNYSEILDKHFEGYDKDNDLSDEFALSINATIN